MPANLALKYAFIFCARNIRPNFLSWFFGAPLWCHISHVKFANLCSEKCTSETEDRTFWVHSH